MVIPKYVTFSLILAVGVLLILFMQFFRGDEETSTPETLVIADDVQVDLEPEAIFEHTDFASLRVSPAWMIRRSDHGTSPIVAARSEAVIDSVAVDRADASSISSASERSAPPDVSWFIAPYTLPKAMLSITEPEGKIDLTAPFSPAQPPSWVETEDEAVFPGAIAVDKETMLSRPPSKFNRDWITHESPALSSVINPVVPPVSQPPPVEEKEDDPEALTKAMFHLREAESQTTAGMIDQAIGSYRQALANYPKMFYANRQLGRLLLMRGLFQDAIHHLLIAAQDDQMAAETWNDLGIAYLYIGQSDEALSSFNTARTLDDSYWEPVFHSGLAMKRLGRIDEAHDLFIQYREQFPLDARVHRELAMIDAANDDHASALARLDYAIKLDPSWTTPVFDASLIHAADRNHAQALAYLELAMEKASIRDIIQVYNLPVFQDTRLQPESKVFESKLAAKARKEIR